MRLPHWGYISEQRKKQASTKPPGDWVPKSKSDTWDKFFKQMRKDFSLNLWPEYQPGTGWTGGMEREAEEATKAELKIHLSEIQGNNLLATFPDTPLFDERSGARRAHEWHYYVEDLVKLNDFDFADFAKTEFEKSAAQFPFANIVYYDPEYKSDEMPAVFGAMASKKADGLFRFKTHFSRPRPYTAAAYFGMDTFKHVTASRHVHTGVHPAFPSGHCAQGLLVAAGIYEDALIKEQPITDERLDALMQFAVDFGDRRVFAGVHYPTDNVASWVTAVELADRCFDEHGDAVKAFIVEAITEKSTIYKIINDTFGSYDALKKQLSFLKRKVG